jgi:Ca2+-binding RTX toxin-like protein
VWAVLVVVGGELIEQLSVEFVEEQSSQRCSHDGNTLTAGGRPAYDAAPSGGRENQMGSVSLTAVNAFGDPRAARRASARVADHGYAVVAADRFREVAIRGGLVAIVGAGRDHERIVRISERLHGRIAALAIVGGPLGVLLGQRDGLAVPTLVVGERVGRRERRRVARRLPRGSMVVRAADFDAALDEIVSFLDRAAVTVPVPIGRSTSRPLALRLAPAALAAPAAAALLAGSGAVAAAAVCTPVHADGVLTITCDGDGAATLKLSASVDGDVLVNGEPVAKLSEIQQISILTTAGDDVVAIDESAHKLTTGPDDAPILLKIDAGEGLDELAWIGSSGNDSFKLSADGIDVAGGDEFEHKIFGVESLKFVLGEGNDEFDGGSWELKIEADGGPGKDNLIGGLGPDVFKLSPGGDDIDGRAGFDLVRVETDDKAIKITGATIELTDSLDIVHYKELETLDYLGDATASKIEIDKAAFATLKLDGGGGGDLLDVKSDDDLIKITDEAVSLNFSKVEIDYKEFSDLSVIGGVTDSKVEIADFTGLTKLKLEGGGGLDVIKLSTNESLLKITDSVIGLGDKLDAISHKDFAEVGVIGGEAANKFVLDGFTGLFKLKLEGGGEVDSIKFTTPASLQITESLIVLGDNQNPIEYKELETLDYLGDATASKIEIDKAAFATLKLDGGGGGDLLDVKSDDDLIKITDEAVSLNFSKVEIDYKEFSELKLTGGDKANAFEISDFTALSKLHLDGGGDADWIKLTTGESLKITESLIVLGDKLDAIDYKELEAAEFLGATRASKIEVDNAAFDTLKLDGGGGLLELKSDDSLIKISDTSLNFTKTEFKHSNFGEISVIGGDGANKFELDGFTGLSKLKLEGGGGIDVIKLSTTDALVKITDSAIGLGDKLDAIAHKDFESLSVLATNDIAHTFDGSLVTTLKLTLDGGSKDDTLLGGSLDDVITGRLGRDKIAGGFGNDTILETANVNFVVASDDSLTGLGTDAFSGIEALKLTGGLDNNILDASKFSWGPVTLDGGAGNDLVTGGAGDDVLLGNLGDDVLSGNQGADNLFGGEGNDALIGGAGIDVGDGGPGIDSAKGIEILTNIER